LNFTTHPSFDAHFIPSAISFEALFSDNLGKGEGVQIDHQTRMSKQKYSTRPNPPTIPMKIGIQMTNY
jgi:hypothetical protein